MTEKNMDELARQERLEYYRKWRAANKEKVKQHNQNYWRHKAKKRMEKEAEHGGN